jgi:glutamate dehydrogenase
MLLSYSKIWLSAKLLESDIASDPYLGAEVTRYFPKPVQRRWPREIQQHSLRREIIVTATTNSLVNRMGPVFAIRTQEDTGADIGSIARAFTIAREMTGMRDLWADIEALDDRAPAALQYDMGHETVRLLRPLTYWVLRQLGRDLGIERAVSRLRPGLRELAAELPSVIGGIEAERYERELARFSAPGVPASVARRVASLGAMHSGVDIVEVALARRAPIRHAARVYFGLGAAIGLDWIRGQIERLAVEGHWQALARGTLREDAYSLQRRLCERILAKGRRGDPAAAVESWLAGAGAAADGVRRAVQEMRTTGAADFPTLSVALQSVRRLAER